MITKIAPPIPFKLRLPEFNARLRHAREDASFVSVPEATMDENHRAPRPENKIGLPRKITSMEAVTMAHPMDKTTHDHFDFGILATYAGHSLAAL